MADKGTIYEYDDGSFSFRRSTSFWRTLSLVVNVLLVSVALFVVGYLLLATFLSTDTEKRLRRENRAYEKLYSDIVRREALLGDAVAGLQLKDDALYQTVFHSKTPSVDPVSSLDFLFGADTIPDDRIVSYTRKKAERMIATAVGVDSAFARIYRTLASDGYVMPPMTLPVERVSYPQVGASTGLRLNPFLNAEVAHNGLDLLVPQGSPVLAPEAGKVVAVSSSSKGEGKSVELEHEGGYVTRYTHLFETSVKVGQKVAKGARLGTAGMSGNAFAPHLHYEVYHDGEPSDPVNHLFASLSPGEYANFLFMSINTVQSMD